MQQRRAAHKLEIEIFVWKAPGLHIRYGIITIISFSFKPMRDQYIVQLRIYLEALASLGLALSLTDSLTDSITI